MDFNIELTEFPSVLHSHIYAYGRRVMPLSRTLDSVTEPALRESCIALHGFVTNMISDIYDNPAVYYLPVMKLEEFCDGKPVIEVKRQFPKEFKSILSQTGNAVPSYLGLLCKIGCSGVLEGSNLIISEERLKEIKKKSKSSTSPITFDKRIEALNRVGFVMEISPIGEGRFISESYPNIFPALCALADKNNFTMLDFRNIYSKFNPTHEEYFEALIAEQREIAYELHNVALEHKMRASLNANWGVIYNYKGKQAMRIRTGNDVECYLSVRVIGKDKNDSHTIIEKSLENEPQDIKQQVRQHLTGCDANQCLNCSTFSSGNYVTVLGKEHQMCGEGIIGYEWHKLIKADMGTIKRLIEIRCEIIDEAQVMKK